MPGHDNGPKYKNSSESAVYAKSRLLYGLNWAKGDVVAADEVVVCEGYTDVIGFAAAGMNRAVSTCGTALIEEHVKMLRRFARRVVLAFDADAAGQNAPARFYEWKRAHDLDVAVADLPAGVDPGDLSQSDPARLAAAVEGARPFLEFPVERELAAGTLGSAEGRARTAETTLAMIREHPDPLVRDQYAVTVATRCRLGLDLIRTRLAQSSQRSVPVVAQPARSSGQLRESPALEALKLAVQRRDEIADLLIPELFEDELLVATYDLLQTCSSLHQVIERGGPEVAEIVQRLSVEESTAEPVGVAARLWDPFLERLMTESAQAMASASADEQIDIAREHRWLRLKVEDVREPHEQAGAIADLLVWVGGLASLGRRTSGGPCFNTEPQMPAESSFAKEYKQRLLLRAKAGRQLNVDDVLAVMPRVEHTTEVLAEVGRFMRGNGIPFDDEPPDLIELSGMGEGKRVHRRQDPARVTAAAMARASASADPVRMYLKEIGEVPLLTAPEEVSLAKRIEKGASAAAAIAEMNGAGEWQGVWNEEQRTLRRQVADGDRARQELTSANLRLVMSIAKRHVGRGVPILDLVQEGNLGLMRAVQKFDYTKGFKFSTYATWWIRQAITRAIADHSRTIRVQVHMVESINQVLRTQRSFGAKLERDPTIPELVEEVDLPAEKVEEILRIASQDPLSLDTPIGDEDDTSMADFIADKGAAPLDLAARKLLEQTVRDVLGDLSDRESEVVRLRFGLEDGRPRTLEEVGREFGVTRERIRQIESKTLAKLRHPLRSDRSRDYLD